MATVQLGNGKKNYNCPMTVVGTEKSFFPQTSDEPEKVAIEFKIAGRGRDKTVKVVITNKEILSMVCAALAKTHVAKR
ncbi:hypothetical protein J8F10_19370 [Gemmata sp. G18]|uniref:Uncharacterized protein n=1 Tax=Gemmata palustris TaxID=2822762 RepID=A0ABS5BUL8_9BACT|nr:hypothetical protein [Gemmata palustris]MBP3957412.1 hypothetical protein [Gemmata palustris]